MSHDENIAAFFYFLKLEKGLSINTITSYQSDINQFLKYLQTIQLSYLLINEKNINKFIKRLKKQHISNRSIARKLSSIKQLYLFLLKSKKITSNPFNSIALPKTQSLIPKPLSEAHIEMLLSSPDETTTKGYRDKTMIGIDVCYWTEGF